MEKVSAILCHHMGKELVLRAIKSIQNQKNVQVEIIVASSVENASFYGTKTLHIKGGPAYKRNMAFKFATSDYIAFFDDDIEAEPYALYEMLKVLKNEPQTGCVFGKLRNLEFKNRFDEAGSFLTSTGFLWSRAASGIEDKGQYDTIEPILAGKSAAMLIKRNAFAEAGFFDASYEILGEETDLAWRVWLAGYKVLYAPSSLTYHAFNTRFKPDNSYTPKRVYFNGCRNYISMLLTNLEIKNLIFPILCQTTVWFSAGIGMLVTGKFEAGINIIKGLCYVATHLFSILSKRKSVQSKRKIKDRELLPWIMSNPPKSYYIKRFFHYIKTGRHG